MTFDAHADEHVRAGRVRLSFLRYLIDDAIMAVPILQDSTVERIGITERRVVHYNPGFVLSLSVEEVATVLYHEVLHALRDHLSRARARGVSESTAAAANIAMDVVINHDIREEIATLRDLSPLPEGAFYPETIGEEPGHVWEWYYDRLLSQNIECSFAGKESTLGNLGPEGDEEGPGADGAAGGKSQRGDGDGDGKGKKLRVSDCGSGAHGVPRAGDAEGDSAEGVSDADWREIQETCASKVAAAASGRSDVPLGLQRWAERILTPAFVPWDQVLTAELSWAAEMRAGDAMLDYARPGRRSAAVPYVFQPGHRDPVPQICVLTDTSGSMTEDHDLALVRGVVEEVCSETGSEVRFLAADTEVHADYAAASGHGLEMPGGGGTDMRQPLAYAGNLHPEVDVILVITDCDMPRSAWPDRPPSLAKVIVLSTQHDTDPATVPTWARLICINPNPRNNP